MLIFINIFIDKFITDHLYDYKQTETNRNPTHLLAISSHKTESYFLDMPYHLINKRTESRIRLSVPPRI